MRRRLPGDHVFWAALLALIAVLVVTVKFHAALPALADFVLVTLVVLAAFLTLLQLAPLVILSLYIMNWQPAFGAEAWVLLLAPFVCWGVLRLIAWRPWASSALLALLSVAVFYLSNGWQVFVGQLGRAGWFALIDVIFAILFFQVFNYFYAPKAEGS